MQRTILLVDDDDDLRPIMIDVLEEAGYRALEARDVAAAREALGRERVDAVLLDWNLEGETSQPLLDELTTRDNAPATLLFSATTVAPTIAQMYEVPLIAKPFELETFENTLRRVVEGDSLREASPAL
jgi:DNA-binding NtrC family response regulator